MWRKKLQHNALKLLFIASLLLVPGIAAADTNLSDFWILGLSCVSTGIDTIVRLLTHGQLFDKNTNEIVNDIYDSSEHI